MVFLKPKFRNKLCIDQFLWLNTFKIIRSKLIDFEPINLGDSTKPQTPQNSSCRAQYFWQWSNTKKNNEIRFFRFLCYALKLKFFLASLYILITL